MLACFLDSSVDLFMLTIGNIEVHLLYIKIRMVFSVTDQIQQ